MNKVFIDFETRSEVDIWEVGAAVYASHPSTSILCICYAIDDDPVITIRNDGKGLSTLYKMASLPNNIFVAHNAFFERMIWRHKLKALEVPVERWICTLAMAAACGLPKALDKVASALNLTQQKDKMGKRAMLAMSKPRPAYKGEDPSKVYWRGNPELYDTLCSYCAQDVETERELYHKLPKLSAAEHKVWRLDQALNERGVQIDIGLVKKIASLLTKYSEELNKNVKGLTGGYIDKVSRNQALLQWLTAQGVSLENAQKATILYALENTNMPPKVREVLTIKKELAHTSVTKYEAMINATADDGRLRDTLQYHSASTGRWGGKLVQLQNLPKGNIADTDLGCEILNTGDMDLIKSLYPSVMELTSSCIRGMIIASPGKELFVGDYASIEARVLVWLAGEQGAIKQFERGEDLYVKMAERIFNKKDISKKERAVGKTAVLGCGYGMGKDKFQAMCAINGIDIPIELADTAVRTYRETYPLIPQMWYAQERAAVETMRTGKSQKSHGFLWFREKEFLCVKLLSGRVLRYFHPGLEFKETPWGEQKQCVTYYTTDPRTKQLVKTHTYGGKIVENLDQATARDIMVTAMFRCDNRGYSVILTVHDEIVSEKKLNTGSVDEFINIMCQPIKWAKGCPIKAEGWKGHRYKK